MKQALYKAISVFIRTCLFIAGVILMMSETSDWGSQTKILLLGFVCFLVAMIWTAIDEFFEVKATDEELFEAEEEYTDEDWENLY